MEGGAYDIVEDPHDGIGLIPFACWLLVGWAFNRAARIRDWWQ